MIEEVVIWHEPVQVAERPAFEPTESLPCLLQICTEDNQIWHHQVPFVHETSIVEVPQLLHNQVHAELVGVSFQQRNFIRMALLPVRVTNSRSRCPKTQQVYLQDEGQP